MSVEAYLELYCVCMTTMGSNSYVMPGHTLYLYTHT
jgi:hypothetical protein